MTGSDSPRLQRRIVRGDGVDLAVRVGRGSGPAVVFVHGYPDTAAVWDQVIDRLLPDFTCVAYDVRGAGDSSAPDSRAGYRLDRLLGDLVAVLDAVSPDEAAHLVGHDWGSVQGWNAVLRESSDARLRGRLATFTSISGPALEHVEAFVRDALRGGSRRRRTLLGQAVRSSYVAAFQLPVLPELVMRGIAGALVATGRRPGGAAAAVERDAVSGLELYRANLFRPRPGLPDGPVSRLPVQLLVPLRDPFLSPRMYDGIARFAPNLRRVDIDAGHWVQRTHAHEVARYVAQFATDPPAAASG